MGVGHAEITAVIPAFNREATIGRALQSVLDQTSPVDAILVVDDGSSDGTVEAVAAFGDRVQWIEQPNAGAAAARNTGVAAAGTEWIAFLDSDDYWESDHIERTRAAIAATDGSAGFYFADMYWPESDGSLFALSGFAVEAPYQVVTDATDWVMMRRQPMMLQASVLRTADYLGVGGMRPELRSRHDSHLFLLLGIGKPACALEHRGTVMTADATGGRVTEVLGNEGMAYWWETREMYADVLTRCRDLPKHHRIELSERLAAAHLRLARFAWSRRNPVAFAWHLGRAAWIRPGRFLGAVGRRLGGA